MLAKAIDRSAERDRHVSAEQIAVVRFRGCKNDLTQSSAVVDVFALQTLFESCQQTAENSVYV